MFGLRGDNLACESYTRRVWGRWALDKDWEVLWVRAAAVIRPR